jgi:hypothetical protein
MLVMAVLNLLSPIIYVDFSIPLFVATFGVFISSVTLMGKGFKKITMIFMSVGIVLLVRSGQSLAIWMTAINSMTNVISILIVMQLFSIPIEVGNYDIAVRNWFTKSFKKEPALFLFTTVVTHIFSSFLMFGTIPVMISLLGDTLKRCVANYERFASVAISRGYALVTLWSPGAINLLLVSQATNVKWIEILIPGLVLSLIGIITSYFVESKLNLAACVVRYSESADVVSQSQMTTQGKVYHIIVVVISLVALTAFFDRINLGSAPSRIMLAGIIVVLIWTTLFTNNYTFPVTLRKYWNNGILKAVDLAPLFISMGVFSTAVQKSGLIGLVQNDLQGFVNVLGGAALVVVPILLILFSLLGVHPFISIVMFGQLLTSLQLPISQISLALCLALGGSISYILSPFAGIVLTLAKFLNCRTVDIAVRWNWVFSLLFFIEGILFAYILGRWLT